MTDIRATENPPQYRQYDFFHVASAFGGGYMVCEKVTGSIYSMERFADLK